MSFFPAVGALVWPGAVIPDMALSGAVFIGENKGQKACEVCCCSTRTHIDTPIIVLAMLKPSPHTEMKLNEKLNSTHRHSAQSSWRQLRHFSCSGQSLGDSCGACHRPSPPPVGQSLKKGRQHSKQADISSSRVSYLAKWPSSPHLQPESPMVATIGGTI